MDDVLVTGGTGWFGRHFARRARQEGWPVWLSYRNVPLDDYPAQQQVDLDICDGRGFDVLRARQPRYIVHAAAVSKPGACEADRRTAWQVNVEGTARLASAAAGWGGAVLLLSSDLVFDGRANPYAEDAQACPTCFYGFTKLEAEKAVLAHGGVVARLSLMYGARMPLWEMVKANLIGARPCELFVDLVRSPTWVGDVIDIVFALCQLGDTAKGLWHVASPEPVDRYRFGLAVASAIGGDAGVLSPTSYAPPPGLRVPPNIVLSTDRLFDRTGLRCHNLADGVRLALADERDRPATERVVEAAR